jgi:hypothetical protein
MIPKSSPLESEPDPLFDEVRALVGRYQGPKQLLYAGLVKLALDKKVGAEDFRRSLLDAKLPESRASQVKAILEDPVVAKLLSEGTMSLRDALRKVQHHREGTTGEALADWVRARQATRAIVTAAQSLVEAMVRAGAAPLELGVLKLTYTSSAALAAELRRSLTP